MRFIEARSPLPTSRLLAVALFAVCVVAGPIIGCSNEGRRAPAVNAAKAREALQAALESWKKGESVEALKSASPPIVIQDFDWMGGKKLVKYEVAGDGKDDDANLRIPVKLTLRASDGQEIEKLVSYVVGTSPTLTVFRDFH
jgi:hypothetical protein